MIFFHVFMIFNGLFNFKVRSDQFYVLEIGFVMKGGGGGDIKLAKYLAYVGIC